MSSNYLDFKIYPQSKFINGFRATMNNLRNVNCESITFALILFLFTELDLLASTVDSAKSRGGKDSGFETTRAVGRGKFVSSSAEIRKRETDSDVQVTKNPPLIIEAFSMVLSL